MKFSGLVALTLIAGASAFSPAILQQKTSKLFSSPGHIGSGGMADTRDPSASVHEDARKSIGVAPSFEEYMKQRAGGAPAAPAAAAPVAPAPVAAAPVAAAPAAWSPGGVPAAPAAPAPAAGRPAAWSPGGGAAAAPAAPAAPAAAAPAPIGASAPAAGHIGSGGMADTRDPSASVHEDARKSIGVAPSFEEYMKQRAGGAPAAPAPAAAAPVAAAPAAWSPGGAAAAPAAAAPAAAAGGGVLDTLTSLEGPGQVWGADGIAVGKEESDFKEFDNFNLFFDRLQSSGVAAELAGAGPFTVFAPVNTAIETYEMMKGPVDAAVCRFHIVTGLVASSDVSSADLSTLAGTPLTYRYAVRKHFVNDAIIGEKTFGPFSDYPIDVAAGNGVVHGVGLVMQ